VRHVIQSVNKSYWNQFIVPFLFLFLICTFLITCTTKSSSDKIVRIENGILDLSEYNFETDGPLQLQGEVEFYWNKLLTVQDFASESIPLKDGYITIPGIWNNYETQNSMTTEFGYATYRFFIKNIGNYSKLGIQSLNQGSNIKILTGNDVIVSGKIGKSDEDTEPSFHTLVDTVTIHKDPLEVIIQVSNYHDNRGGLFNPIYIGKDKQIVKYHYDKMMIILFIFGAVLIMSLYHFGLYYYRKKNISVLYFGIFCLLIVFRSLLTGERFLLYLIPDMHWLIVTRGEYLSYYLADPVFLYFIYTLYPKDFSKKAVYTLVLTSVPFILIVLFFPITIVYHTLILYEIHTLIMISTVMVGVVFAVLRKREGAILLLSGFFAISLSVVNDILVFHKIIDTVSGTSTFGLFILIFIQSFILARSFSSAFSRVESLSEELEDKVEARTKSLIEAYEKLKELDKLKSNFFANISHEIRTPLTLILSPVESALQGDLNSQYDTVFLNSIHRNAVRLLKLINNLLDFSKLEAGRMILKIREVNVSSLLRNYVSTIYSAVEVHNIDLDYHTNSENCSIFSDIEKLDKIIMNILSNSIKFTEEGGSIKIELEDFEDHCTITITDSGVGIPTDKIDSIFDRFNQVDTSSTRKYEGTGIGLALAKELTELLCGTITLKSRYIHDYPENHGTSFTLTFPKGTDHFDGRSDVEYIDDFDTYELMSYDKRFIGMREMQDVTGAQNSDEFSVSEEDSRYTLLIVEDNADMREFISMLLQDHYDIETAENGIIGLKKAARIEPDLIITDVMMPEMNGYDFTKKIKDDEKLKRTPVLMITAKADLNYKLEGLEYGADDYLTKPFNSKELLARIRSLLKTYELDKKQIKRKQEIEEELEIARLLQKKLLPDKDLELEGYKIHTTYIPMDKVGGDFYDFYQLEENLNIVIADVSGHGLPGAFLATIAKISLNNLLSFPKPKTILSSLNEIICQYTVKFNYVTLFLCSLNTKNNTLKYTSAGHFPQLVYRSKSDEFFELNTKGVPLGWFSSISLEEKVMQLESGDRLILFTDGIIECFDENKVLYGEDQLKLFIKSNIDLTPKEFSEVLISELRKFAGSNDFNDDLTMVVLDVL
jgi:two-component system sensor histidine kinase ChiS